MVFELILRQGVWFHYLPGILVILTLPSCVSLCTHSVGVAMCRILPAPRRAAMPLSRGRINSHFKHCLINVGAFAVVNSKIFEIRDCSKSC